jgi:hypothetical protein
VEANTKTGEVKILRFLSANDSGRVMNRLTYDNQVIGGITMGIGLAMTEARILDRKQTGKMVNRNWHDYKIPTALDVPAEVQSVQRSGMLNVPQGQGLTRTRDHFPAAAITDAIYHATGIRMKQHHLPIKLNQLPGGKEDDPVHNFAYVRPRSLKEAISNSHPIGQSLCRRTDLLGCLRDGVFHEEDRQSQRMNDLMGSITKEGGLDRALATVARLPAASFKTNTGLAKAATGGQSLKTGRSVKSARGWCWYYAEVSVLRRGPVLCVRRRKQAMHFGGGISYIVSYLMSHALPPRGTVSILGPKG